MQVPLKAHPEERMVNTRESTEQATDRESTMVLGEREDNSEKT
jgi:hypothetical protein